MKPSLCVASLLAGLAAAPAAPAATFTTPTPYRSAADNPLATPAVSFAWQHLETFEDGLLNSPGLFADGGVVATGTVFIDSVDADDGLLDGQGGTGHSWFSGTGPGLAQVSFSFNNKQLGQLPTHVGLAFTDLGLATPANFIGLATMAVFDSQGVQVASTSFEFPADGTALSNVADDRFLGVWHAGGISAITVGYATSTDWEVDHVFYAYAPVPEPAAPWLLVAGLGALGLRRAYGLRCFCRKLRLNPGG